MTLEIDQQEVGRWGADWIADNDGQLNLTVALPFLAANRGRHVVPPHPTCTPPHVVPPRHGTCTSCNPSLSAVIYHASSLLPLCFLSASTLHAVCIQSATSSATPTNRPPDRDIDKGSERERERQIDREREREGEWGTLSARKRAGELEREREGERGTEREREGQRGRERDREGESKMRSAEKGAV